MRRSCSLILAGLLFPVWLAFGQTTYYVDDLQGSDDAAGTGPATAWKSVGKASRTSFRPGDQILFRRGGVWHEQLTTTSPGTPSQPVTYGAYGSGPKPLIDVNNLITGPWAETDSGFTTPLAAPPSTVFVDAVKLQRAAAPGNLGPRQWYYDAPDSRLILRLTGGNNPAGSFVEWTRTGVGVEVSGLENVRITDLAVAAPWDDGPDPPSTATGAGIRVDHCRNVALANCTVTGAKDENVVGIHIVDVPGFSISGCEVSHTLYGIAVVPAPAGFPGLIEGCTIHDMDKGPVEEWDGINVGSSQETDFAGLVIRKNNIFRCGEDGVDIFYCRDVLIEENYIHDGGTIKVSDNQQGIKSVRPGNIFRYNRIENIASAGPLPAGYVRNGIIAGGNNTQVCYNVVIHCGSYGILVDSAQGVKVYNNTVLDCPIAVSVQGDAQADLRNNIVDCGLEGVPGRFDIDLDGSRTTVTGGHNLLVNTSGSNATASARYSGSETDLHAVDPGFVLPAKRPLSDWSLSGRNIYAVPAPTEPRFVVMRGISGRKKASTDGLRNTGDWCWSGGLLYLCSTVAPDTSAAAFTLADFNGLYRLRDSSPCGDGGVSVGFLRDVEGTIVAQGLAPDIGAFERQIPGEAFPPIGRLFDLAQNYPNPFNPSTALTVYVGAESSVKLRVYDLLGREVALLLDEVKLPGRYTMVWNTLAIASGTYIARLEVAGEGTVRSRMMLHIR